MKGIKQGKPTGKRLGDMHEKGSPARRKQGDDVAPNQRWWTLPENQVPGSLRATIKHIMQTQSAFEMQRQVCARLYGGMIPSSSAGASYDRLQALHPSLSGRLTYNVISIAVDSLIAKVTKDPLSVQFITQGGNYRQQRQAKKLTQFSDGITYETKMDAKGADAFRDGVILNEGIVHTYEDWRTGRVASERVIPSELYVDEVDGLYGFPTQMHRVRNIDKDVLLESQWAKDDKKLAEAIKKCHVADRDELGGSYQHAANLIAVGESWHLPSGMDPETDQPADDGKHVIYIDNAVLNRDPKEQKWKKMRFPFSVYRWKPAIYGWHGISLAQELIGSQVEMNHLLIMFQRAFRMMAAFRIWVETGTVPDQHFQDKIGTILHGPKGSKPPVFLTPQAMSDQYFKHFNDIKERAFEIARLSQQSAVGTRPAGIDSGEAQRVYHDIENEGFSYATKQYEDFRLDVVQNQIDCVRDIFQRDKGYKLTAPVSSSSLPGTRFLRSIDWKDVNLKEEQYILRGYSTSSLPSTPAGKLATVQDLMRAGLIDGDTGRKLLNFPDLAQVQSLLGAAEDWIMSQLDDIIENGQKASFEQPQPHPYMLLALAQKLGVQEYALGAANNMEEEKLDRLGAWIGSVEQLQAKATAAQQQQAINFQAQMAQAGQPPQGAAPMGKGAPAQTSPMLPPEGMAGAA